MDTANVRQLITDFLDEGDAWILVVVLGGWFFSLGVMLVYPVLLPQIIEEYGIDYGTAGLTLSVLWLGYAFMNAPGGLIADKIGERNLLVTSTIVALLGIVSVINAPTFPFLIGATFVLGTGCGLYGTTGTTVLTDVFPDKSTIVISFSQVSGTIGTIVLPVIAGLLVSVMGWRIGLGYVIPGFATVAAGLWLISPARTSPAPDERVTLGGRDFLSRIVRTLADQALLLAVAGMACVGFVYQGLTGFLPSYLIQVKDFTQQEATIVYGIFFVGMIVAKLACGPLSRQYGRIPALIGFVLSSTPAIILIPFLDSVSAVAAAVFFAGTILGYSPIVMAYIILLIPDDIQGSVYGIVRTGFFSFGVLAPPTVGFFADIGLFDAGILFLGLVGILVVAFSLLLSQFDMPSSTDSG